MICVGCRGQGGGWRIDAAGVVCVICSRHDGGWRSAVRGGGEDIRLDSRSKFLVSTRGNRAWGGAMFKRTTFCFAFCSSIEEFEHDQDEEFCKSESDILQEYGDRPRNAHFLMSTLRRF